MRRTKSDARGRTLLALLALGVLGCGHKDTPSASVARAIAARLGTVPGLGQAVARNEEVDFSSSKLALVVSERESVSRGAHFHVLARLEGGAGTLDACILGIGATPNRARENVPERYVELAFAPMAALVDPAARVDALPFSGDEPYGVAGYRGFVGEVSGTPTIDEDALSSAALFAGLGPIPADGRVHLAKAIVVADKGSWMRTLELDGQATAIASQPWSGVAPPKAAEMAIRFAVIDRPDTLANPAGRAEATRILDGHPAWLAGEGCPADVMPATLVPTLWSSRSCVGGRLRDCVSECERGRSSACYSAAIELQKDDPRTPAAHRLYLRACHLGDSSACTNAAAGRATLDACSVHTFEKTCAQTTDAWGCAMLGLALAKGEGVARDAARARGVLHQACAKATDDPACKTALAVLAQLDAAKRSE